MFSPDRKQRLADAASRRDAADRAVDRWVERLSVVAVPRTKAAGTQVHYLLPARETYYIPRVSIEAYLALALRDGTLGKARPIGVFLSAFHRETHGIKWPGLPVQRRAR